MIEVRGVSKSFGSTRAVEAASFDVAAGELLALVGGSGSGKTTLLKLLNRLIEPDEGTVRIAGDLAGAVPEHVLRRTVGYVCQKVGLFPHMTVAQNIAVTPSLLGWAPAAIEERVSELMLLLQLDPSSRNRLPAELSGGQQQRVGVARALAARPRLVLFDEPFGALDPITRDNLQQSFEALRKELGMTAVLVTHDIAEAVLLADRIGVLQRGHLVQIASTREILTRPATEYVARLLETPRRHARVFDALCAGADRA